DSAVLLAPQPIDESGLLQPVDEASNARHHGNGAAGDFQNRQRLAFASEDAEDVVLRRGQAVFPQQAGAAMLKLVAGTHDAEGRFFFGRVKGPLFLEFVLQFWHGHGLVQAGFIYLLLVYTSTICMSSPFLAFFFGRAARWGIG